MIEVLKILNPPDKDEEFLTAEYKYKVEDQTIFDK